MVIPLIPALCHSTSRDTPPTGPGWVAEGKWDGWCYMIERTVTGIRAVGGRNSSDYSGQLPYLDESLMALPVGTILHGELISPAPSASGHGSSAVGSVMTRTAKHVPHPLSPALIYVVFDVLAVPDAEGTVHDVRRKPWKDRRTALTPVAVLKHVTVSPLYECSAAGLAQALADGLEGLVCKRENSRYVPGRSASWMKVKPQQTAEAIVVGFKDGEAGGRWDGLVGAFELEMLGPDGERNGVLTTAKCGTDLIHYSATAERDALARGETAKRQDRWLGLPVELAHHGLSRQGVPRHPQVKGRRDDLIPRPARRASAIAAPTTVAAGQASRRNYLRMTTPGKLERCIAELAAGEGAAYDRVIAAGADPAKDLEKALAAATQLGIDVSGVIA